MPLIAHDEGDDNPLVTDSKEVSSVYEFVALVLAIVLPASTSAQESFDIVINGGRVIDPQTGLDASGHVVAQTGR